MSVDTRTPRTPTGDRSSGYDDAPALSMVKVPSDPAQVIVNHASFRVQFGASARRTQSPRIARHLSATQDPARMSGAPAAGRRRAVVWSGRSDPDDTGAHRLLQAVRAGAGQHVEDPAADHAGDAGATQVIPRVDLDGGPLDYDDGPATQTLETPLVGAQRGPLPDGTRLLPAMRTVGSAYDEPAYDEPAYDESAYGPQDFGTGTDGYADDGYGPDGYDDTDTDRPRSRRRTDDPARHAYFPGRRMNLGVVLLPLRVFLGFISIYAGMGKLCDPVYFDGGERGSMVKWLNTLHPWDVAEPLRQFALAHPVGAGLVIAFLQVLVGVLTVLGCWQRVAAVIGAALSAALLVTVSWKSVPVYDAPDIIYLAAWSPLIIAGAPVYSVDGRLAGSAWRRLGPRSDIWDLRRYVLRRGAVITFLVAGVTLLVGSVLGGAVRDADRVVVPGPGEAPRNELPGSPLPQEPGTRKPKTSSPEASASPTQGATSGASTPSGDSATTPGATRDSSGTATGGGTPSQTQGTTGQAPPRQSTPADQAPSTTAGPTAGGTSTGGSGGSTGSTGSGEGGGGSSSTGEPGGRLVGGLLG
ncbi:DoxX family membrane protein [Streptomyces sp. RK23]|uniref:DoxX family protein n=1 Tax=unclassified Streptomyces TaxID=2593676 RepID=UPI001B38645A|nr:MULTISPECIES: DoxX family protein [unclassified Streptomyces]MBQ0968275.1 DoxX family membrane protein [Streptomyces sp. RK74B]MBQ1004226.1 DoxX family membrane protein [Streptomyces sp. RK23]